MVPRKSTDIGAEFEQHVQEALTVLRTHHHCMFERKYDSKSAGAFLPAQPGDFAVQKSGKHVILECKSSNIHDNMDRKYCTSNLRDAQVAGMRMWMRSGSDGFYLFKDYSRGLIHLWPGEEIIKTHITPRYTPDKGKVIVSWVTDRPSDTAQIILLNCFNREISHDLHIVH